MHVFRSILFAAVLSGLLVGLATSALQHLGTTPLILAGERYEKIPAPAMAGHAHAHAATAAAAEEWEPAAGLERNAYTVLFNVLAWIGFGLVLAGGIVLLGRPARWREGLLWGLAGFAVFALAPTVGLPPELPGVPAAPLGPRQVWWVATAVATGSGLWLLVFRRSPAAAFGAIALIALPHLVGAPALPDHGASLVPAALSHRFATTVLVTSFVSWALLGSLTGFFYRRFSA